MLYGPQIEVANWCPTKVAARITASTIAQLRFSLWFP